MEKENNKSNNTLLIVTIVMGIIILGLVGYIFFDKVVLDRKVEVKEAGSSEVTDIPESNKASEDVVNDLLKNYYLLVDLDDSIDLRLASIYNSNYDEINKLRTSWEKFSSDDFSSVTCSDYYSKSLYDNDQEWYNTENGVCKDSLNPVSINYDKLNKEYKTLFGTSAPKSGFKSGEAYFFIDYKNSKYIKLECGACGGTTGPGVNILKVKDYSEDDDQLTVNMYYERVPATDSYGNSENQYSFDLGEITINGSISYVKSQITARYMDLIDTYTITFDKKDGSYVFNNMKKN